MYVKMKENSFVRAIEIHVLCRSEEKIGCIRMWKLEVSIASINTSPEREKRGEKWINIILVLVSTKNI